MRNFRSDPDGIPEQALQLPPILERLLGKPVVGQDTALYWAIFRDHALSPEGSHGALLESLDA